MDTNNNISQAQDHTGERNYAAGKTSTYPKRRVVLCPTKTSTANSPPEATDRKKGHTYDDLFRLLESLRGEFRELRVSVAECSPLTSPLSETLEAVRADVGTVDLRLKAFGVEASEIRNAVSETTKVVAEIAKACRRIESKVNGVAIDCAEIKGILHNHEARLRVLESP